jgi:5-methylcytosine-specific restriction protein A
MFIQGQIYRRRDLHKEFGGQQQGGISTPASGGLILLFTAEAGEQYGYKDDWTADGIFLYTGEGQHGDMQYVRGNLAIRDHLLNGKDLHLFEYARDVGRGLVRYVDQMICTGSSLRQAPDTTGATRNAIVFELTPIQEFTDEPSLPPNVSAQEADNHNLEELRKRALASSAAARTPKQRKILARDRSNAIRLYVLKRSKGNCEGCGSPAPFQTPTHAPYLEPHHIRRLSDGGPDHPRWVVAICPNCHRRAHYSQDASGYNERLAGIAGRLEPS